MISGGERNRIMENNTNIAADELMPFDIAEKIAKTLFNKQARDVKMYRVTETTIIADYYVICTGRSSTHVRSLSDEIQYELECVGVNSKIEGVEASGWILVDFGSVIVHVFNSESRGFYKLERLLETAEEIDISYLDVPENK